MNQAKSEFFKEVLHQMSSGVMTLQMDGRIVTYNPAAAFFLGVAREDVLNKTFDEIFLLEQDGNDAFTQMILDAVYEPEKPHEGVVPFDRSDGTHVSLNVKTASMQGEEGACVIVSFHDVTAMENLRTAERALNDKLQNAYLELEQANGSLTQSLKKVRVIRITVSLLVLVLCLVLGSVMWGTRDDSGFDFAEEPGLSGEQDGDRQVEEVIQQPLTHSLTLSGMIEPLELINIVSPFEGRILNKHVKSGQAVAANETLITLDRTAFEKKLHENKATYIKALHRYEEIQNWEQGMEYSRARRSLMRTKNNLSSAQKKQIDVEYLFEQGIVAESELISTRERTTNLKMELQAAQEELSSVLKKGGSNYVEIAKMELENARIDLEQSQDKIKNHIIRAPVAGIVLTPKLGDKKQSSAERGTVIGENEVLVAIGNMEGLTVRSKVDEIDIGDIKVGMPVQVTGDAFDELNLTGYVARVSSEARKDHTHGAVFDIEVVVPNLPPDALQHVRLGMSSTIHVLVYQNPNALMLPIYAVSSDGEQSFVQVLVDEENVEVRPVETGITTLDAVEIRSGLSEGDQVVVP